MVYQLKALGAASVCSLLLAISHPGLVSADLVVDDDGVQCPEATHANLQAAVDAAQPGDTLLVCPGSYSGTVTIGAGKTGLTLLGQQRNMEDRVGDPAQESVLAGSPLGSPGFAVQADDVTISDFTIMHTGDTGIEIKPADGVTPVSGASMERNRLDTVGDPDVGDTNCAGGRGMNFEVTVGATAIDNYITSSCGAGIRLKSSTDAFLHGNVIDGSRKRPGIAVRGSSYNRIHDNSSFNNREAGISLHSSVGNRVLSNHMAGNGVPGDPLRPIPGKGSNTDADDTTNLPLENKPDNKWSGNHCMTENRAGLCDVNK